MLAIVLMYVYLIYYVDAISYRKQKSRSIINCIVLSHGSVSCCGVSMQCLLMSYSGMRRKEKKIEHLELSVYK